MNDRLYRTRDDRIIAGVAGGVADYFGLDPALVRIVWAVLGLFSGGALVLLYIVMWVVVPEEPFDWAANATGAAAAGTSGTSTMGSFGPTTGATADQTPGDAEGPTAPGAAGPMSGPAFTSGAPGAVPPPPYQDWRAQRAIERAQRRATRRGARLEGRPYRRDTSGAVIFGLILVVLGGWFLLQQFVPWLDSGRIWPVILILIGAVVLIGAIRPGAGGDREA